MSIENRLEEFQALPVNWDGYGGLPTTAIAAKRAMQFVSAIALRPGPDGDSCTFCPSPGGGVEWESEVEGGCIFVTIRADGRLSAEFVEDEPCEESEQAGSR